jgi:NADPH:quinone reductase-like Zn-dependent oxidoreductase
MAANLPAEMPALRLHEPGGPERLVFETAPTPEPGTGDVLVEVHAASFTPTELTWSSTFVDRSGHDRRPIIPCYEVSGVIVALGWGTAGLSIGDEVYGLQDWYRDGAAAGYIAVEARNLAPRPRTLSHVEAATLPLAGLTALQALFDRGGLVEGRSVLIHGAGGGVGTLAVQLAHAAGARVVASGRAEVADLVLSLGADSFVDVAAPEGAAEAGPVALILDIVGGAVPEPYWAVLEDGGVFISIVAAPSPDLLARHGVRGGYFVVEPDRRGLAEIAARADDGDLRAVVGRTCSLQDAPAVLADKESGGGIRGKVAIAVRGEGAGSDQPGG